MSVGTITLKLFLPVFPQFPLIPVCSSIHQCSFCPSVSRHTLLLSQLSVPLKIDTSFSLKHHVSLPYCIADLTHVRHPFPFTFSKNIQLAVILVGSCPVTREMLKTIAIFWESMWTVRWNTSCVTIKLPSHQSRYTKLTPVAYAENFHGGFCSRSYGGYLYLVSLLVTSQFDVISMFPNQRFGEVCWHNMHNFVHPLPLFYGSLHWI